MPELPEVETTRRGVEPHVTGHRIAALHVYDRRLRWPVPSDLARHLVGATIERVERRSKYLLFRIGASTLLVHLGMTGSLRVFHDPPPRRPHDHVELVFDTGVRLLYNAIRDVMGAFVGEKKRFSQPVLITLDVSAGTKALGFLTQNEVDDLGVPDHVSVYLPQSYNFAGQTLLVPRDRVTRLTAPSSQVMTFVISGGVAEVGRE